MEKNEVNSREYYTVDLMHIIKSLWHRAWIIVLCGILCAGIGFAVSSYLIKPEYSSSIMLYVNNSSISLGNTSFSISSSEITAAQSLVKTYSELLMNRTTLERVIEKTGIDRTYQKLYEMIEAGPSNDTEIMKVTVVSKDPYEAAEIANCIAEVLPERISEIIDGASMEVVDDAIPNLKKISPSITRYTAVGLIVGALLAVIILAIIAMTDDTIRDEEYVLKTYDYPILAKVPNLLDAPVKRSYYKNKNYYYKK